jgi:hypothetical protein
MTRRAFFKKPLPASSWLRPSRRHRSRGRLTSLFSLCSAEPAPGPWDSGSRIVVSYLACSAHCFAVLPPPRFPRSCKQSAAEAWVHAMVSDVHRVLPCDGVVASSLFVFPSPDRIMTTGRDGKAATRRRGKYVGE